MKIREQPPITVRPRGWTLADEQVLRSGIHGDPDEVLRKWAATLVPIEPCMRKEAQP